MGMYGLQRAQSLQSWVADGPSSKQRCLKYRLKWKIDLCIICIAVVGEAICLYDHAQWGCVKGKKKRSEHWILRNTPPLHETLKDLPVRLNCIHQNNVPVMPKSEKVDKRIWWLTVLKPAVDQAEKKKKTMKERCVLKESNTCWFFLLQIYDPTPWTFPCPVSCSLIRSLASSPMSIPLKTYFHVP